MSGKREEFLKMFKVFNNNNNNNSLYKYVCKYLVNVVVLFYDVRLQ